MSHSTSFTRFRTGEFIIDFQCAQVLKGNEQVKVRPKTFEMLKLLVCHSGELVTKENFLSTVWDDVTVDEQVLFQSVKELRKVFCSADVIKTFPRKGYAWVAPLEKLGSPQELITPEKQQPESKPLWRKPMSLSIGLALFCLAVMVSYFFEENKAANKAKEGALLILPVETHFEGNEHKWVRFGAMDQVIQRLKPSVGKPVMLVEDVLEAYAHAGLGSASSAEASPENIERLFKVSGAGTVVELFLGGAPGEYQLLYKLHYPKSVDKGVIFDDFAPQAFDSAAKLIAQKTGQSLAEVREETDSEFANELLATAIENMNKGGFNTAAGYLRIIVEEDPDNIIAKRHLAWAESQLGRFAAANVLAEDVINRLTALGEETDLSTQKQLGRIRYVQASNYLKQGQYGKALETLKEAYSNTDAAVDLLYQGNINEMMGKMYFDNKEYASAAERFQQAADYYEVLQCPYGRASVNLSLADVAFQQGLVERAVDYSSKAYQIAAEGDLKDILEHSEASKKRYQASLSQLKSQPMY